MLSRIDDRLERICCSRAFGWLAVSSAFCIPQVIIYAALYALGVTDRGDVSPGWQMVVLIVAPTVVLGGSWEYYSHTAHRRERAARLSRD